MCSPRILMVKFILKMSELGKKTWKKSDPPVRDEAPPGEGNRGGFRTGRKAAAEPPWSGLSVLVPTKGDGGRG